MTCRDTTECFIISVKIYGHLFKSKTNYRYYIKKPKAFGTA